LVRLIPIGFESLTSSLSMMLFLSISLMVTIFSSASWFWRIGCAYELGWLLIFDRRFPVNLFSIFLSACSRFSIFSAIFSPRFLESKTSFSSPFLMSGYFSFRSSLVDVIALAKVSLNSSPLLLSFLSFELASFSSFLPNISFLIPSAISFLS
jgi:hypothetical protein